MTEGGCGGGVDRANDAESARGGERESTRERERARERERESAMPT